MLGSLLLCAGLASATSHKVLDAAVRAEGAKLKVAFGRPSGATAAWGSFEDGLNTTGWGVLTVETSRLFSDQEQHRAAGMVEGFLTARHIHTAYLNAIGYVFNGNVSEASVAFLEEQVRWARGQAQAQAPADLFWRHAAALLAQLDGLMLGYKAAAAQGTVPDLPESAFLILNGVGDLFQIMPAVDLSRRPNFAAMTGEELRQLLRRRGMCSGLVKVPGGLEDLFMAHSSWFEYSDMDRIFKHYHFQFHMPAAAESISFSSYPGYLESLDDFYMMSSGLGMVQTSNNVMNNTLLDMIQPHSLLAWQRVRLANAMAHNGSEWHQVFKTHASGTYVNQYMVVDFGRFTPGKALLDDTLWVVEEIPGLIVGADQTQVLRLGYWPSYNVPFYRDVYTLSGYEDDRLGPDGDYQLAPRAKLFRRDQGAVSDMESLKRLMRYANYSDEYARGEDGQVDIGAAICMRGDLGHNGTGRAGGCYDTKVTSFLHGFWNRSAQAVNGPTSTASDGTGGKSGNAPFAWRPLDSAAPHWGLPPRFDFDFIAVMPRQIPCGNCSLQQTVVV